MRTSFILVFVTLVLASGAKSQNVGIGTTSPLSQLSVGSLSQFQVNSTGNLVRINNIPYSFPTEQGANQYLKNDGNGNLSWAAAARPVVRVFSALPNGTFSAWLIDNPTDYVSGLNADPTLVLQRGLTYQFSIGGHPFWITAIQGTQQFPVGVTNNGASSGFVTYTVPVDAPATMFYFCSIHPSMAGTITIL